MAKILIVLVRGYQFSLSYFLGKHCRFYPTCSHYCIECLKNFSLSQALKFTLIRLSKCHPLSRYKGYDPVPFSQEINKE